MLLILNCNFFRMSRSSVSGMRRVPVVKRSNISALSQLLKSEHTVESVGADSGEATFVGREQWYENIRRRQIQRMREKTFEGCESADGVANHVESSQCTFSSWTLSKFDVVRRIEKKSVRYDDDAELWSRVPFTGMSPRVLSRRDADDISLVKVFTECGIMFNIWQLA